MREHKCEGSKKIWMKDYLFVQTHIQNGQSAANLVSDNKTVQRLDKVRLVINVINVINFKTINIHECQRLDLKKMIININIHHI